jgi:hypothetical protein
MRDLINLMEAMNIAEWEDDDIQDDDDYMDDEEDKEEDEHDGEEHSTTNVKFGTIRAFYNQVVAAANQQMDSGEDIEISDVANWVEHHKDLFTAEKIPVHRTMRLPDDFIENLQPGAELGQHWTYEFDEGNLGDFDMGDTEKGTMYTISAMIGAADVHFPLTVAYNCLFPHEMEIFLAMRATPKVIKIIVTETGEEIRQDLYGQEFRS